MADGAQVQPAVESLRFAQRAHLPDFARLSVKNGLLNLITLTLYRFWGKTVVRRGLWASTYLNDEPFEYTGRGKELFLGFLFATLLVTVPFLLIVFGAQFLGPLVALPIVMAAYVVLPWLYGAGQYLAFRYWASRTTWRGIRFAHTGNASGYAWYFLGQNVLKAMTWGWWGPHAETRLAGRLWGRLWFGDRRVLFYVPHDTGVYGAFAIGWFGSGLAYIIAFAAFFGAAFAMAPQEGEAPSSPDALFILVLYLTLGLAALIGMVAYAPYRAAMLRLIARQTRYEGVSFSLDLSAGDMIKLTVVNVLLLAATLGFAAPYVQARTAKFVISRLSAHGETDLAAVNQTGRGPRHGEGIADAFGFSPF